MQYSFVCSSDPLQNVKQLVSDVIEANQKSESVQVDFNLSDTDVEILIWGKGTTERLFTQSWRYKNSYDDESLELIDYTLFNIIQTGNMPVKELVHDDE